MSGFTRTHGDAQPVFALDILNGAQTGTIAAPALVQMAGPKLDFFSADLGADPAAQLGTGGAIEAVIRTIQQLGTVHFYQVQPSASDANLSWAMYDADAWGKVSDGTAAFNMQAAIQALVSVNGYTLSGADINGAASTATAKDGSNAGFHLATA